MNTELFIKKAQEIHGNKYDYSKSIYKNSSEKICIICPEHGEFYMKLGNHINGKQGCPKCGLLKRAEKRRKSFNTFIEESINTHGNKYDYSKVEYINIDTKVCIICPEHGEFWQIPYQHIKGNGCPKCNGGTLQTKEDFIKKAILIHEDKYDYSKVEYINSQTKVCIICPEHGEFWQTPGNHIYGNGCPKCSGKNKTTENFIQESIKIHENKYDYSKTQYKGIFNKVTIICPEHGEFLQTPHSHLRGNGCPKCFYDREQNINKICREFFKEKAMKIHGNKYDYSKVEYINSQTKVCIICPKHGEFWQTPNKHLNGQGCPICKESSLEEKVRVLFEFNNIYFEKEKRFENYNRIYDFYIPDKKIIIECQGVQHFKSIDYFSSNLDEQIKIDEDKFNWCIKNNLKILYLTEYNCKKIIPYNKGIYTEKNVFFNTYDLLKNIEN